MANDMSKSRNILYLSMLVALINIRQVYKKNLLFNLYSHLTILLRDIPLTKSYKCAVSDEASRITV